MINKVINLVLDILIVVLLWYLVPVFVVLFTPAAPVYAKLIGISFALLIACAVVFAFKQHSSKAVRKV